MQVTVGLPFFNARATLRAAIASVFNQTFQDWELVLLDDGSTDGSRAVAEEALGDPRVRLFSDGENRGLVARLNQLAAVARAPALARMDADDVMHPERLRLQLELLRASGADLVGSSAYVMDAPRTRGTPWTGLPAGPSGSAPRTRGTPWTGLPAGPSGSEHLRVTGVRRAPPFSTRAEVLRRGGFIHPSCLGRTAWFRANPYDGAFLRAEDLELWARTVERSRFAFLDRPLLFYREPQRPNLAAFRATWRTERKILRRYGPGLLGRLELARRILFTHGKALAYRLASPFPAVTRALLRRRNAPLPSGERAEAEAVLARAAAMPASRAGPPRAEREVLRQGVGA